MDGNGRWAQKRLMPRFMGHRKGVEVVKEAIRFCADYHIQFLSLFAFSTENWKRPRQEVAQLMGLFKKSLFDEQDQLLSKDARLRIIGDRHHLPEDLVKLMHQVEQKTQHCKTLDIVVFVNYGGRWEIIQAAERLAQRFAQRFAQEQLERTRQLDSNQSPIELAELQLNEEEFAKYLPSADIPDPDLLIRTSGESRLSNFMLWQLAYTELVFLGKPWPDVTYQDFVDVIETYYQRSRRFGSVSK